MQREMEKLRGEKTEKTKASSMATPTPKIPAPSPANTPVPKKSQTKEKHEGNGDNGKNGKTMGKGDPQDVIPPADRPVPHTEGAKLNRLRRLCERKPSGRCHVPQAIHEKWAKSTRAEKEAMIEELEKVNWSKDWLLNQHLTNVNLNM